MAATQPLTSSQTLVAAGGGQRAPVDQEPLPTDEPVWSEAEIAALAKKVYQLLRTELRITRERQG